jgi:hypothetical protein
MSERLEKEKDYFVKNMIEWSKTHLYKFALIKEESLVGVYNTIQDAFNAGLSKYGLDDFFIKQIIPQETINVSFLGQNYAILKH